MWLKSARLQNYKCFLDSGTVQFGKHWTVVVGQNNSGKSTFLSTLKLSAPGSVPYKGIAIDPDLPGNPESRLSFEIEFFGSELKRNLLNTNSSFYWSQNQFGHIPGHLHPQTIEPMFQDVLDRGGMKLKGVASAMAGLVDFALTSSEGRVIFPGNTYFRFDPNPQRTGFQLLQGNNGASDAHVATWLGPLAGKSVYKFDAERMHIGNSTIDNVTVLQENGSNLAQVLLKLKENDLQFGAFMTCVKAVLPNITRVVPTVNGQNHVTVEIQFHDSVLNRPDLSFSLRECGTGTSQVLCILYVVVTSQYPKTIVIDEPNSFLHPGAAKRLIEVLKNYSQHQFIIATHSPELIQVADPDKLLLVKWSSEGSLVSEIDRNDIKDLQFALGDLGVGLSDVFGLEKAIWVEGPTEATCFPAILRKSGMKQHYGVGFVPIRTVGSITGSQKVAFFDMYRNLVATNKILPTAIGFSLDTESLATAQKEDLSRQLGNLLKFLPRRCFENYLLHPQAISSLLESLEESITSQRVQDLLTEKQQGADINEWLHTCDGAKVIKELFTSLTGSRHEYSKVRHGQALVEWILDHDADFLAELKEYVLALCAGNYDRIST